MTTEGFDAIWGTRRGALHPAKPDGPPPMKFSVEWTVSGPLDWCRDAAAELLAPGTGSTFAASPASTSRAPDRVEVLTTDEHPGTLRAAWEDCEAASAIEAVTAAAAMLRTLGRSLAPRQALMVQVSVSQPSLTPPGYPPEARSSVT
jgi:hypothetical protein